MDNDWNSKLIRALKRHVPILGWILDYTREDVLSDIIAGVTISLTIIPQSIAYAALAGLDPQYGLNSAFMGCFIYVFFGTIKEVVIGPSSLMALLTYEYTQDLNSDFVILFCFICGIVELLMGIFQLGFLVSFISAPVISGFTTATSIIILVSQIKGLLGLNFKSSGFVDNLKKLYQNGANLTFGDTLLGVSCIIGLLSFRKLKDIKVSEKIPGNKMIENIFWFLATGRNALTVCIGGCISFYYKNNGFQTPFITTKNVESGIPPWKFPPTSTQIGNETYNFQEMVAELGSGCIVIPVVSIFANVAIAKAFASGSVDATQEMLTLSLCNIFGSFVQSMPTTGAFTRSAVISSSGVRSPLACLYSACLTLLALQFLSPYFHYIPRSSLSAVLISAVIFMIDWEIVLPLWRANKFDFLTLIVSFVASLCLGVEVGLLFGVAVGLGGLIHKWARPNVTVEKKNSLVLFRPEMGLYFPSVDYLSALIIKNTRIENGSKSEDKKLPVVIDCSKINGSDFSTAKNFKVLSNNLKKRGQKMLFLNLPAESQEMWKIAGCEEGRFCTLQTLNEALSSSSKNVSTPLLFARDGCENSLELETLSKGENKEGEE